MKAGEAIGMAAPAEARKAIILHCQRPSAFRLRSAMGGHRRLPPGPHQGSKARKRLSRVASSDSHFSVKARQPKPPSLEPKWLRNVCLCLFSDFHGGCQCATRESGMEDDQRQLEPLRPRPEQTADRARRGEDEQRTSRRRRRSKGPVGTPIQGAPRGPAEHELGP